ncbi:hypothetical protein SH203_02182 [Brevundimonas sp. SH203]|uniref:hypothetical protein n=1 Tax=Brevundimonas sp. SH203 TaxID=345167 RepID=UPI0009CCDAE5|nr:hypothetical protein [Brevundimonas sp. SH203]GAW41772.1 hypothetical protein SH203_02182 [Brevundimonas sp. SH203]
MTLRPSLMVLALAVAASPALAQTASQTQPYVGPDAYRDQRPLPDPADREALLKARGEAYHRAGDDKQTEEELRATRALNDEIAARNALADKTEAEARLEYDAAVARRDIAVRQAEEQARAAAEATRAAQEQYDRDYAAWREQVRLCQSGVRSACGTPVGPAR